MEITTPAAGEGSYGGAFAVTWSVEGFALDADAMGAAAEEGHGHVHVYVDDVLFEETADSGTTVDGLASGDHTIEVRLAENDHTELELADLVDVRVRNSAVRILAPANAAVMSASSVPLTIAIDDFDLSATLGGDDVFGTGHYRVLVDGEPRDWSNDPLLAIATGLTEGARTIGVELVTNDGRPLDPPVVAEIDVSVPVGVRGVYWDRSAFDGPWDSATLPLAFSTTAFTLWDRDLARPPVEGEGHVHLYMDGEWLDVTAETSRVLQNVPPGDHVFEARLVTNDGFELPVVDRLWVDVPADRPDVLVTYPGPGWRMAAAFDLTYTVENFQLNAGAMDGANGVHEGHAQVLVDGLLVAETADTLVPLSGLLPGTHLLRIQLANNDRTPVEPAVYTEFSIIVE